MSVRPPRLAPQSITAQITTLVVAAVVGGARMRMNPEAKAASEAARVATVVRQAEAARTPAALAEVLASAQMPGTGIRLLHAQDLPPAPTAADAFTERVAASLRQPWALRPLVAGRLAGWTNTIAVDIGDGRALAFQESPYQTIEAFLTLQAAIALAIIFIVVLAVSTYAIRWVTRPLSAVAEAARAFGRSPDDEQPLDTRGPAEIAQVAVALNEMRTRVRRLVDERTRMLAAISHDLRTPLTRLRLRSERVPDAAAREHMLRDLAAIDAMIGETLAYLRDGGAQGLVERVDLPSLLQTICGEFSDLGHDVRYKGPGRFAFTCRAAALARAVTNLVDNGVKHGANVTVTLTPATAGAAHIEVADDGPGIPPSLRERAFEPFYKADSARSASQSGFGLGLSIARDIVERHGGSIVLADNLPRGLRVCITLDAGQDAASWMHWTALADRAS